MQRIDEVYENLRERVFQAEFKPNEMITEREICACYGVSRVTAGEALHRLCHEGHLTAYPRTGYMVTALTPADMTRLKRLRMALETLVVRVLCTECQDEQLRSLYGLIAEDPNTVERPSAANRRFHVGLARLTSDPYLIDAVENVLGAASRVEQYVSPEKQATWQDCHKGIVDALCARDAELAVRLMTEDLNQR